MGEADEYEAIVVGGGLSGTICAASLAIRGVKTLLIAETKRVGHNVRSVPVDGHRGYVQQAAWHFGWGGGNWARVIREHNLPTPVHLSPPIQGSVRGSGERTRIPVMFSASAIADFLFKLLPVQVQGPERMELERVLHAGLMIPYEELCLLHDVPIAVWLDEQQASDMARLVIELLAAVVAGLPQVGIGDKFSVFGVFVHIRTYFGGDGYFTLIEPDIQRGFVEPLAAQVVALGGDLWTGVHVDRMLVEDGSVSGVRLVDGRVATAARVALAVGNERLPRFFDELPAELVAPLSKEAEFLHTQVMVITVLEEPVIDITDILFIHDLATGANLWMVPLHAATPWNAGDDRQFCLQWWAGVSGDRTDAVTYMDDVFEDQFPGWKRAIGPRQEVGPRHHWLNPCYVGPKVPRRSPGMGGLFYVGESTEPVGGIASEQAAYAGYQGALEIAAELGRTELLAPASLRPAGDLPDLGTY